MTAAAALPSKPDYGLDSAATTRAMFTRGAWTLVFAIAIFFINHSEYPGPAARLLIVLGLIGVAFLAVGYAMVWSSRVAKFQVRDQILDSLGLKGDEKVLDVGSGRGLMLIGVAKRLKTGRVVGLDFSAEAELARENAKLEGAAEKVRIESGNPAKLVYPDANYDVVVSALALRQIGDSAVRARLLQEMWRVLKPGGRMAIFDVLSTGDYEAVLREAGAAQIELSPTRFLWCLPTRTLTARK